MKFKIPNFLVLVITLVIGIALVTAAVQVGKFRYKIIANEDRMLKYDSYTGKSWVLKKIPNPGERKGFKLLWRELNK